MPILLEDDDDDEQVIEEDEKDAEVLYTDEEVRRKWVDSLKGESIISGSCVSGLMLRDIHCRCWVDGPHDNVAGVHDPGGGREGDDGSPRNPWEPFETETDWRFASWAIQEGIKLSAIESFLKIPGVSPLVFDADHY